MREDEMKKHRKNVRKLEQKNILPIAISQPKF